MVPAPATGRSTRRRPGTCPSVATILLAIGLSVSGCATGTDPATTRSASRAATPSRSAVPDDIPSLVVKVDPKSFHEPGPDAPLSLVEFFLAGGMRHREEELSIERATAVCMQRVGWRYLPAPGSHDSDLLTLSDLRAYRTSYGYGVVGGAEGTDDDGPNLPIYASLSAEERARYLEALTGPDTGVPYAEQDLPDLPPEGTPGCRPQAQREVRLQLPRYDEALKAYLATNRPDRHPLLVEADRRWGKCMQVKGFDLTGARDLNRRLGELGADTRPRGEILAEEKALGLADLDCHLADRWHVQRVVETALLAKIAQRFPRHAQRIRGLPA